MTGPRTRSVVCAFLAVLAVLVVGSAGTPTHAAQGSAAADSVALTYCKNIRNDALDARYRWQVGKLKDIAVRVDEKIRTLSSKTEELRKWYEMRQQFVRQATTKLVEIFERMRAEAAAAQLTKLAPATAAALILKLETGKASAILNEMSPVRAAELVTMISDAAGKGAEDES